MRQPKGTQEQPEGNPYDQLCSNMNNKIVIETRHKANSQQPELMLRNCR